MIPDCICKTCGKEMTAEYDVIRPGCNDPFLRVTPCCPNDKDSEKLENLTNYFQPELEEIFEDLDNAISDVFKFIEQDTLSNLHYDLADLRLVIKTRMNDLLTTIKEVDE